MSYPVLILKTPPTIEPLTLAEIKKWMRISSYSSSEDISPRSTIAPGAKAIGSYTGNSIDIAGYNAYFIVDARTNGTGGTVTLTIKESNDNINFTVWTGTGFSQITEANDNQFFKLDYTGTKRYLRIDAVVAGNACEFGVNIMLDSPVSDEDDVITRNRKTVRQTAEQYQGRAYLPQTWQLILNDWPCDKDYIDLKISPVRSITSITYKRADGTTATWDASEYYLSKVYQKENGKVYLGYSKTFPTETLWPFQAITVEFEAGFADLATYQQYMNSATDQWMLCANDFLYKNRDKSLDDFSKKALNYDSVRVPFA